MSSKRLYKLSIAWLTAVMALLASAAVMADVTAVVSGGTGNPALSCGGVQQWNVQRGDNVVITLNGVPSDCTNVKIVLSGTFAGTGQQVVLDTTGGNGTFSATYKIPNTACETSPIKYRCGDSKEEFAVADTNLCPGLGGKQVHIRAVGPDGSQVSCSGPQPCEIQCPARKVVCKDEGKDYATVDLGQPTVTGNCTNPVVTNDHPDNTFPVGTTTVTWTLTYDGGSKTCTQDVVVKKFCTPSGCLLSCPEDAVVECGGDTSPDSTGRPVVEGGCEATFEDEETPGCGNTKVITRTWSVTTDLGTDTCEQTITVVDTTAPTISAPGADDTIQCPAVPEFTAPTAEDSCGTAEVQQVGDDVREEGSCAGTYKLTRTWKAVDACGNASEPVSQTITVVDTTPPTISEPGDDETIDCPAEPVFTPPTAEDSCGTAEVIQVGDDVREDGSCAGTYKLTRTWQAKDACGNLSERTVSQTITVQDITPPEIGAPGEDKSIECPAVPEFTAPTAKDLCDPNAKVVQVGDDVRGPGVCAGSYTLTRTWKAVDACLNESGTVSQTITVTDTTDPVVKCNNVTKVADFEAECLTANIKLDYTVEDCDTAPTVVGVVTLPDTTVVDLSSLAVAGQDGVYKFPLGTSSVELTVTDSCGNSSTCTFTVTITECPKATRTVGFWQTHLWALTNAVNAGCVPQYLDTCLPSTVGHLEAILWGNISKQGSTARTKLGQARMQLGQQLVAAVLNRCILGTNSTDIEPAIAALQGTNVTLILQYVGILDLFNRSGDTVPFKPSQGQASGAATPDAAKAAADKTAGVINPGPCYK